MNWILVTALLVAAPVARAAETDVGTLRDRMAQGKLDADLGRHDAAALAFAEVAEDPGTPPALQGEALIRWGAARRAAGDHEGAIKIFDRAWRAILEHDDPETLALLVAALGEALPGRERWEKIWKQVPLVVDRSHAGRPALTVSWPDVPARETGRAYLGHPITLDFKDGDLRDVFRLFADIAQLNVVVFPGSGGKVTAHLDKVPWDEALERVLAPNGLTYRWEGNVVTIGAPRQLGTARRQAGAARTTRYVGAPIDVDFKEADLRDVLSIVAANDHATVAFDPRLDGEVTIKLNRVPWDQVFDIVARTHGLEWARQDGVFTVSVSGLGAASGPAVSHLPEPPARLDAWNVDQVVLRGIVKMKGGEYVAQLRLPDQGAERGHAARLGAKFKDGEITAIDATTVTFRRHDGREIQKALYPSTVAP